MEYANDGIMKELGLERQKLMKAVGRDGVYRQRLDGTLPVGVRLYENITATRLHEAGVSPRRQDRVYNFLLRIVRVENGYIAMQKVTCDLPN